MKRKAPGKFYRKGLSLKGLMRMFPDDNTAREWFIKARWPEGIACPNCGSVRVNTGEKHKTMPYRCRDCRKRFSPRTGTALEASNLGYDTWAIAIYLLATGIKGVSSMKLHRDLQITQRSAWFLAMRLRRAWEQESGKFLGPVEADEAYFGGRRRNMSNAKRKALQDTGRGAVGKTAVVGIKDRASNQIRAKVVERTDAATLQGFVRNNADRDAIVYTDEAHAYNGVARWHEAVQHSVGEYVRGMAHTNGVESFWSLLKRGFHGTYHQLSVKHLDRYVQEFSGRHNVRGRDTIQQMGMIVQGLDGKRLRYSDLTA